MSDDRIANAVRALAFASAAFWAVLGIGWHIESRWAVALWPWPEVPMTFILLASMAAFIATVWATVAWSGELAALSGAGLNMFIGCAGTGAQLWKVGLVAAALAAFVGAALGVLLFAWARRLQVHDARPSPPVVRGAFLVFAAALALAGGALALQQQVLPWPLHPSSRAPIGALFVGAAAYFTYAVMQPAWVHAAPPLWGFLAYDLILFAPYLKMLSGGSVADDDYYGSEGGSINMTSLSVYLTVLGASAVLALYCIFVHPSTRLLRRTADRSNL